MILNVKTPRGHFEVLIDDEDFDLILEYGITIWKAPNKATYYARFTKGKMRNKPIHRIILNTRKQVDHINGNGLDNRRENLREATTQQNCRNRKRKNSTSKFGGVSLKKDVIKGKVYSRWVARIQISKTERLQLGSFKTEIDAAKAYDKAAKKYFGEFARLNFPEEKT